MNRINEFITKQATDAFRFMPTKKFYATIQIKQKRFGQLMRNEKDATYAELERISEYFSVSVDELITKK